MNAISRLMVALALSSGSMAASAATYPQLNDSLEWQQQVTDSLSGTLAGLVLYTSSSAIDYDTISIGIGPAFDSGPFAYTTTAAITEAGTFINTAAADIPLTTGEQFVIDVSGNTNNTAGTNLQGSFTPYSGGDLFEVGPGPTTPFNYTTPYDISLAFETYVQTASDLAPVLDQNNQPAGTYLSPVPLPASAWLLLSAIGALGIAGRRRLAA